MMRAVALAITASLLAVGLAGCFALETRIPDLIGLRQSSGGEIEIRVCRHFVADGLVASERNIQRHKSWSKFFELDETFEVASGDTLALDADAFLKAEAREPRLLDGDRLEIFLDGAGPNEGEVMLADFDLAKGTLPTTIWLLPDGSLSEDPCTVVPTK